MLFDIKLLDMLKLCDMEPYTSFTTNKKGHLLIHPVLATIIILLALIFSAAYVFYSYLKINYDETPVYISAVETPAVASKPIVEINFTKTQTVEEKKALLVNRLDTVNAQPLFPSEKQAILSEYGDTNKTNLTETEKQQIIRALNK